MEHNDITTKASQPRDWKSHVISGIFAALAVLLIVVFYDQAVANRVMLSLYYVGVASAAYLLVWRRSMILMEVVVFAAVGRTLAGVYFAAKPGLSDPILIVLGDLASWFVVLYLGWRLAAEAHRFHKREVHDEVAREVDQTASAARGSALVATSREIHQPLTTMRTITDALLNEPPNAFDPAQLDSLADMDRCINHLMALVNNLLDYGRAEARMIHLQCESVTLPELIDQCAAAMQTKASQGGIEIHCHVSTDVGEVTADPLRLKQIVYNLLSNAVESNRRGGIVNVQVRRLNGDVLLSVRDTGKGISSEEMKSLFNPYQANPEETNRQISASLGLSLAKRLVEMHGGSMTMDSVADSGTIFNVRLPVVGPSRPTKEQSSSQPEQEERSEDRDAEWSLGVASSASPIRAADRGGSRGAPSAKPLERDEESEEATRVLVADANPSVRRILRQWLKALECEMVEAENGRDALELAHAKPSPHVILLDTRLPDMDGYDVCSALKNDGRLQMIPVILATSDDNPEEKVRAFDAGADDFLLKPINRSELTVRLRSLLRIYQFNQELIGAESVAVALARAVAAKDGYSQGHVGKVANFAVMFGEQLGMDVAELKVLKYGAILHNVGKIAIPDSILEKTGPLTPREMALVHQHPQIGCDICAPLKPLQPVLTIIRHHKERWDGSGYPDRQQGNEIPLGAQIVGLVDAYIALVSNRPYRKAMPQNQAFDVLRQQAREGFYNPELVDKFIQCFNATPKGEPGESTETPALVETN